MIQFDRDKLNRDQTVKAVQKADLDVLVNA